MKKLKWIVETGNENWEYIWNAYDDYRLDPPIADCDLRDNLSPYLSGHFRQVGEIFQNGPGEYSAHYFGKYRNMEEAAQMNPNDPDAMQKKRPNLPRLCPTFFREEDFDNVRNAKRWIETLYRGVDDYPMEEIYDQYCYIPPPSPPDGRFW